MTLEEFRLEALKMAIAQVSKENTADFQKRVEELQEWFYNRIIGEVELLKPPVEKPEFKTASLPKPASGQAGKRP